MSLSRFLDPKNDFAFKKIFGVEKNQDILINFLNDMLGYQGGARVTEVKLIPTAQDPDIAIYKQSIVDVLCRDGLGRQFIVEMQVSKHRGFEKRAQFYAAKAYGRQVIKEDEKHKGHAVYAKLKAVILLAIADFVMFKDKAAWKSEHRLLDTKTYEHDLQDFYFIFLELPKFKKKLEDLTTIEEKWAYFFKHADQSTLIEMEHLIGGDKSIKRAFEVIDQASWSEAELNDYEQAVKRHLDNLAVEQQKIEDAEARGEARGREEGIQQGVQQGRIEIARGLLRENMNVKDIARITSLSTQEIETIRANSR